MRKPIVHPVTLLRKLTLLLLLSALTLSLYSCSSQTSSSQTASSNQSSTASHIYTDKRYDTIYGKWKTADGDILQLNEDGTYWRSGSRSEEGRYSEGSEIIPHGDFYQSYDYLQFQSNDFTASPKTYFYFLDGNHLEMSMYVNKNDGTFDAERTYFYIKE